MKFPTIIFLAATIGTAIAADKVPEVFDGLLIKDKPVTGQIGMVIPPKEIDKYVAKVAAAARNNKQWFQEFSASAKPGLPLPYDEKLGLTKEEYAEYLKLWSQREFKSTDEAMLLLRESSANSWVITATGKASTLSTLRYDTEKDSFRSPNGILKRIDDINASADSVLGEWKGREWKFEEETSLGKTKENIALGSYNSGDHGIVIYRLQELTAAGTVLLDKSLIIRFPLATPKK